MPAYQKLAGAIKTLRDDRVRQIVKSLTPAEQRRWRKIFKENPNGIIPPFMYLKRFLGLFGFIIPLPEDELKDLIDDIKEELPEHLAEELAEEGVEYFIKHHRHELAQFLQNAWDVTTAASDISDTAYVAGDMADAVSVTGDALDVASAAGDVASAGADAASAAGDTVVPFLFPITGTIRGILARARAGRAREIFYETWGS